jgi:hypothetical protein
MPGPLGLERLDKPPELPAATGEAGVILLEQAAYLSRNPTPRPRNGNGPDWRRWHGLRERFAFNHSLQRVLPPDQFETHPDWFAKDDSGKPMRQPYDTPHGYNNHPDLAQPGLRDWVTGQTLEALKQPGSGGPTRVTRSPGLVSASLSLGDSFVFGRFPEDYPYSPGRYFRRWPDWSNHVFDYTNAVAADITGDYRPAEGERLFLGALSYLTWENVPDFPVHPSVVPYLTYDRSQWHDPDARADDLALVQRWSRKGPRIVGTWDYLFGYGFLIPRSLTEVVRESIPELYARGVRAYYSQVYAIWPYDAHINWLTARLLWNPDADPDRLLDEFFREFHGPAAGPMRAFFDEAERIWMNQSGTGWWLRYWKDPWQAALWQDADMGKLEELLEEAMTRCEAALRDSTGADGLDPGRFRERVRQTADLFAMTRHFIRYQQLSWDLQSGPWESANTDALDRGLILAADTLQAREALNNSSTLVRAAHPNTVSAHDLSWIYRYDGNGAAIAAILGNPELTANRRAEALRLLKVWSLSHGLRGQPPLPGDDRLLFGTDFSEVEDPRIWKHQFLDSEGMSRGIGPDGRGFVARDVRRGHIFRIFPAKENHFYLGNLELATRQSPSGEVYIRLDFFTESGELIIKSARSRTAPGVKMDNAQRLRVLMQAPAEAAYGRLMIRFYEMDPGSSAMLHHAEVRDLGFRESP